MELNVEEFLNKLSEKLETPTPAPEPVAKGITADELKATLGEFIQTVNEKIESVTAQKAQELTREEGTGSKAVVTNPMTADPIKYIVEKAQSGKELSHQDKELIWGLTKEVIGYGLE
ncbi:hypothetical protein [Ktedonospora formicarum]|uniref:Uncharacterized protein n=1 Tax=Ktedonospora formicarum TaxID=2778364 RepID=A0A8J3HYW7_9CHLR|nr:hypothetical protein [Ktedonospora formicarum]GHO44521.1 hypothetical protein KSX_26840 [Ktedonospora formicarum]